METGQGPPRELAGGAPINNLRGELKAV
jgi:hypothetical protein